jgi:hypothetical protein
MVTGSLASAAHGRVRATEDIDIVIAPSLQQLRAFVSAFPHDRFYADDEDAVQSFTHNSQFNIIDFATSWKVDLIFQKNREFSHTEFARRKPHVVAGVRVDLATPEDVLMRSWNGQRLANRSDRLKTSPAFSSGVTRVGSHIRRALGRATRSWKAMAEGSRKSGGLSLVCSVRPGFGPAAELPDLSPA